MASGGTDLSEVEELLRELVDATAPTMFGADFWGAALSSLLGVGVGAILTWLVTSRVQKQDLDDRYAERFDARNLQWMDALHRYAYAILEDRQQSHDYDDRFTPTSRTQDAFSEFVLRIRQAGLVARERDHGVLDAIESDVRESHTKSIELGRFDPELVTRVQMLMEEFTRYRRGMLHRTWFAYWAQGTQMPFVPEEVDPHSRAPRVNPTARTSGRTP